MLGAKQGMGKQLAWGNERCCQATDPLIPRWGPPAKTPEAAARPGPLSPAEASPLAPDEINARTVTRPQLLDLAPQLGDIDTEGILAHVTGSRVS